MSATAHPDSPVALDLKVAGPPAPPQPAPILIRPPTGWRLIDLGELWRFRELVAILTWRDVKVRYKQTLLGVAWAVLQPALMMIVFTVFFGRMAGVGSGGLPYPLFAYAGLLPWTFFATAIAGAGNSVVMSERLVTKVYFPRLAIPLASVGAAVVDFLAALGLLAALMAWYGVVPGPQILLIAPLFGLIAVAAVGTGVLLSALNVRYRDFRYIIPFLVQLWMFATPTVYMQPTEVGGASGGWTRAILGLNPLTGLIGAFRAATLGGPIPWHQIGGSAAGAAALLLVGLAYFRRVEDEFADII